MRKSNGFTLIELLVSIAIVLVLVLGVNSVFRIASQSVGAGQALSDVSRDTRAIQSVLANDMANSVIRSSSMPAFIIRGHVTSAFLDKQDMQGDRDYATLPTGATPAVVDATVRTMDLDGNNSEADAGDNIPRNTLGRRNFRQDTMCFFAFGLYPRQTGNDGTFTSNMSSNEAWIWYGQVKQPVDQLNVATTNFDPGWDQGATPATATTNPNNFYARQWGLGRQAILLREPDPTTLTILDKTVPGVPQWYICRRTSPAPAASSCTPLSLQAGATSNGANSDGSEMAHSRYDLAGTSIDGFRKLLSVDPPMPNPPYCILRSAVTAWFNASNMGFRFASYPYPLKPMSSYGIARTAPWLIGGCTQFFVEFAGDFLNQDANTGAVLNNYSTGATDGQVDFIVDPPDALGNTAHRIRWYGFPRDTSGQTATTNNQPDGKILLANDVVPLRDLLGFTAPCEHFVGGSLPAANYANPGLDQDYVVAWAPIYPSTANPTVKTSDQLPPPRPTMVRITYQIDDSRGRLPQAQTFEIVLPTN